MTFFSINGVQMIIGSKPWELGPQVHEDSEEEVGPSMDPRAKKRSLHINETNNEIHSKALDRIPIYYSFRPHV